MKLLVDPEALVEARNAAAFYEDSQPGLGKAFLAGVEAATAEIVRHPLMWRRIILNAMVSSFSVKAVVTVSM